MNKKALFLLFVFVSGVAIYYPQLDFHFWLSQGDHGRDLYSFKKTFEGALPYRDYLSQNGPLMPYYYALFYRIFGVNIQSVLIGYNLLVILSGMMIFLICSVFMSPTLSLAGSLWYWAFRG